MSQNYSAKDPAEVLILSMDFTRRLVTGETIVSATWTITRLDTNEVTTSMLSGSTDISDAPVVSQVVQGGTDGGTYMHRPTVVTSLGQTLVESALQAVVFGGP